MLSINCGPARGGLALAALWLAATIPALATTLPPGFQETIVAEVPFPQNFSQFAFAPDGRLFVADKFGLVRVYVPDPPDPYALEASIQLAVDAEGERGINGLAVDPDFATNAHVWLYYSTPEPTRNRLSRFTYANAALVDERVTIDGPLLMNSNHNGGCLRFASDGTLFIATGDDGQGSVTAQDPFDLRGKLLRIERDGSPAAGNPFHDGMGGDPRVWALGLRNPYRISLQPESDNVFIADVGAAAWEELSVGIAGANFGWSDVEGPVPAAVPGKVYPIHAFPHPPGQGAAIIGGDHAPADFGPGYGGDYFYADFVSRTLWRLSLDITNTPTALEQFAGDFGPATDIQFGPGGALYYVCRSCSPASVRKIEYAGGSNTSPVARAAATPDSGAAPLEVGLNGLQSSDADEDPLVYAWDLGDGAQSDQPTPLHSYAAGVYQATLTVSDGQGGEDTTTVRIVAGNSRPLVTVNTPADESSYSAGQLVPYSGSATDSEEGQLSCAATTWQVFRHHGSHTHPVRGPVQGSCVGVFAIPLEGGESGPDQFYEIRFTARDGGTPLGPEAVLTGSTSIQIRPNLSALTFESTPVSGLWLELDGTPFQTPMTTLGLVNASRTLGGTDPQPGPDGLWYRFQNWSDGGSLEHSITTSSADVTYTANFACAAPEIRNLMINPGAGNQIDLTWDEATAGCLQSGPGRYRVYASTFARPDEGAGEFPYDPPFRLLGTSATPGLSLEISPRDVYFLVVGAGPDGLDGATGHYDF